MASRIGTWRTSLSKTRARVRTRGWGEVRNEFTGKVRGAIGSHDELLFLERATEWTGEAPRRTDEPLRFARATVDDGPDYERFVGTDSATTFAARLSAQTNCWLVRGRGMILHATWTTTGAAWTEEIRKFFVAPPGSAYIYESYTRADARGMGLYPFALLEIGKTLAADGVERLYVGVEVGNAPSIRAITKAGFEPAFGIAFRRRFGKVTIEDATGPEPELAERCFR